MHRRTKYGKFKGRKWKGLALAELFTVLAEDIANGVEEYRKMKKHTTPVVPNWQAKGLAAEGYGSSVHSAEEWDDILKEIVWAFREMADDYPQDICLFCSKSDYSEEEYAEKKKLAEQEYEEYHARIRRGRELFVEYIEALRE